MLLLIQSDDILAKYESAICLKTLIKQEDLKLNYYEILMQIGPIIIQLFTNFFSTNTLWHLIQLLNLLIERCQFTSQEHMMKIIENQSLYLLMENESELLRSALIDMFKNLIVVFNPDVKIPAIYMLILRFIDISFTKVKNR